MSLKNLSTENKDKRNEKLESLKIGLRNDFLNKRYQEFNNKIEQAMLEFVHPQQKYDRYSRYTPYTLDVTEIYSLPEYVNASMVTFKDSRTYTCVMNPKIKYKKEFEDFLIFSNTDLIVSLNQILPERIPMNKHHEYDKNICEQFDYLLNNDNFQLAKSDNIDNIFEDQFFIFKPGSKYEKTIRRLKFLQWPDFRVPNLDDFLLFYNYYQRVVDAYNLGDNKRSPIVVHCLAGVGRTGTFVCFDVINRMLKKSKDPSEAEIFDTIFEVLYRAKSQRNGMVQTDSQISMLVDYFTKVYGN